MPVKNFAYVNKDILVWARGETPFHSPADVELNVRGISATKLELWEAGIELPSLTEAKKLALAYRVPLACFYLTNPPSKKVKRYTDRRTLNGTIYCETSYALWSEINRITANRDKLLEYADAEDLKRYQLPTLQPTASVEEIAKAISEFLGIHLPFRNKSAYRNNAFNYYRNILEHSGIIVAQISGVSLTEMKGLSIYLDPCSIIAINNKDFERAKVFSIFHELAHLIRRSSSLCMIDFDERNDEEEKICDKIAAETLLPCEAFCSVVNKIWPRYNEWSSLCLQDIGDRFGVSSVVVLRRLHELGNLKKTEYLKIYATLNEEFEAKREQIELQRKGKNIPIHYYTKYLNQQGYLFPRAILNAYANGNLSYGEMCRTLNVSSKHIGDIERAVMFT